MPIRYYSTDFLTTLFEKEGRNRFEVRRSILGHIQQGGRPSPFDRIQATRLTARGLGRLIDEASQGTAPALAIGRRRARSNSPTCPIWPP